MADERILTALTPYGSSVPSTRVRVRHWLERTGVPSRLIDYAGLPNHSVGTMVGNAKAVFDAERTQRALTKEHFSRLLIHKEVSPLSNGALAQRLAAQAQLSVYDFDDAVMWTEQLAGNRGLSPGRLARAVFSKARACEATVSAVDRVIAGNAVLAEWAAQRNRDVRLIPSCVEPADYTVKTDFELGKTPQLVWLGSPATEPQLTAVADAVLEVHRLTGARLTVISGPTPQPIGALETVVDRVVWHPGVEATLSQYDIGIAPLFDEPYERGKSAYKILQYGASALPIVGSPVAANATVLEQLGQQAPSGRQAWVDSLMDVISARAEERAAQGQRARQAVVSNYSFATWQDDWLDAVGMRDTVS